MYLNLWGLLGFYSSIELTSVPWRRGSFLIGKIFINTRILQDPFLVRILLIRVNRGVQDVSLYIHSWRPSKAMLDLSQVSFSPSTSFHQLPILLRRFGCLTQMSSGIEAEFVFLFFTECIRKDWRVYWDRWLHRMWRSLNWFRITLIIGY